MHQSASTNNAFGVVPTTTSTSSSLAEAPTSDTESATLLSSGLTTPDTPVQHYRPLREDGESSGSGVGSTPDYENMAISASKLSPLEPRYEQLIATPSPSLDIRGYDSMPVPKPRFQTPRTPYENIQRDFLAAEIKANAIDNRIQQQSSRSPYENLQREFVIVSSDSTQGLSPPASSSPSLSAGTTAVRNMESSGEDDTLEISQDNFSLDLNAGFDHIYTEIMSANDKESEPVEGCSMSDVCEGEDHFGTVSNDVFIPDQLMAVTTEIQSQNVYQNVPNLSMGEPRTVCRSDDDVYEDFAFDKSESDKENTHNNVEVPLEPTTPNTAPLDPNVVYQQVKYLRRSIHEVNALLEESSQDSSLLQQLHTEDNNTNPKTTNSSYTSGESIVTGMEKTAPCPETHFDCSLAGPIDSSGTVMNKVQVGKQFSQLNNCESFPEEDQGHKSEKFLEKPSQVTYCDESETLSPQEPTQTCLFPSHPDEDNSPQEPLQASAFPTHCVADYVSSQEPEQACEFPGLRDQVVKSELVSPSSNMIGPSFEDTSAAHKIATDSRRRFESEIGRELVRERRMTQELEEVRSTKTSPNESPVHKLDRGNKSSVKELLSRFEVSSMDSELPSMLDTSPSPNPSRRSDPHPKPSEKMDVTSATLPPCLRARAARIARSKLTPAPNFSASLDEDQFLRSGGSKGEGRALIRTQTEPDVNAENHTSEEQEEQQPTSSEGKIMENTCTLFSQDDDPQRRERIERYKEERRSFLRKKYHSESFRNEKDETLARLKQKTGGKPDSDEASIEIERVSKQQRSSLPESLPSDKKSSKELGNSPSKSPSKKPTKSIGVSSPTSPEPITCVTVRQRIVTPDKVSLKGCDSPLSPKSPRNESNKFGYSPEKISPGKLSPERRYSERTRIPVSVDLAHTERRPAQLVLVQRSSLPVASSDRRLSAGSKVSSSESNYPV